MTKTYRYLLADSRVKNIVQQHTSTVVAQWASRWGIGSAQQWDVEVIACRQDWPSEDISAEVSSEDRPLAVLQQSSSLNSLVKKIMRGKEIVRVNGFFSKLAKKALEELLLNILTPKEPAPLSLDCHGHAKANTAALTVAVIRLRYDDISFDISLNSEALAYLSQQTLDREGTPASAATTLVSPENCFNDESVALEASYGEINLTLQQLSSIKIGDVIRLNKKINQPMVFTSKCGDRLFEAYLGQREGKLAVRI